MIGDSPLVIDTDDNIAIKGRLFRGTERIWELLTRKYVNTEVINKDDLKTYKNILKMANIRLTRYQPSDNVNVTPGKKFRNVIALLYAKAKVHGVESALRRKWIKY